MNDLNPISFLRLRPSPLPLCPCSLFDTCPMRLALFPLPLFLFAHHVRHLGWCVPMGLLQCSAAHVGFLAVISTRPLFLGSPLCTPHYFLSPHALLSDCTVHAPSPWIHGCGRPLCTAFWPVVPNPTTLAVSPLTSTATHLSALLAS